MWELVGVCRRRWAGLYGCLLFGVECSGALARLPSRNSEVFRQLCFLLKGWTINALTLARSLAGGRLSRWGTESFTTCCAVGWTLDRLIDWFCYRGSNGAFLSWKFSYGGSIHRFDIKMRDGLQPRAGSNIRTGNFCKFTVDDGSK